MILGDADIPVTRAVRQLVRAFVLVSGSTGSRSVTRSLMARKRLWPAS